MSNQLATLMGASDLVELGLDADTLAVAGGATKGNKRISIDGRAFRKFVGGKEVSVNTDISMNVIFVKMAHEASRTFYNQQYKKGVKLSPACWSNDSKTPDPELLHLAHLHALNARTLSRVQVKAVQAQLAVCHGAPLLCCLTILMATCISWCYLLHQHLVKKRMVVGLSVPMCRCLLTTTSPQGALSPRWNLM